MKLTKQIQTLIQQSGDTSLLKALVDAVRPTMLRKKAQAEANLLELTAQLQQDEPFRQRLHDAIENTFSKADLQYIFSESGLVTGSGFFAELRQKLVEKILPTLLPENDLRIKVRRIFSKKWDYQWVFAVKEQTWMLFFASLKLDITFDQPAQHKQLLQAAEILSYQIVSLGFDKRIVHKASHILNPVNAFTAQNKAWFSYSLAIRAKDVPLRIASLQKLMLMLDKGVGQIQEIRKARQSTGTSLQQSFIIERIHQLLIRLKVIVTILDPSVDVSTFAYTDYFRSVVESENTHNRLRSFLSSNFYYLANQITEHGSRTGEKYITNNRKEYYQFFRSAAIGGVIISFAAFIKMELGHLPLAPFWFSFFIGLNYAFAFVIIHLLHGTIATKQPALTASAIATSLDDTNPRSPSLYNLAITIGKVFRSQLASLIGNLVIVYPLTVLIAFMYHWLFGQQLVNPAKAASILVDVQPSVLNVWYAGVAAFLLFLSGIVTGYFDNMVIFGQIPERVKANGFFRRLLGAKKTIRLSKYIDQNLGALMGNIMLGFGLGFMLFFGHIFGLFLDIRHVTISTGFFGFASFATDFQYTPSQWAYYVSGLLAIAATNLLVSFSMALYVALKSRNIATSQLWPLWRLAFKYFFRYPKDFFFPPKRERLPQDLM